MSSHDHLPNDATKLRDTRRQHLDCPVAIVFLRQDEVERRTGLSPSQRDRLEAAGLFPARVPISARSVGWIEDEVTRWQLARIDVRDNAELTEQARRERLPPNRRHPIVPQHQT